MPWGFELLVSCGTVGTYIKSGRAIHTYGTVGTYQYGTAVKYLRYRTYGRYAPKFDHFMNVPGISKAFQKHEAESKPVWRPQKDSFLVDAGSGRIE